MTALKASELKPGDVFRDEHRDLWEVVSICLEPTITMELLFTKRAAAKFPEGEITQISGAQNGLIWKGMKLLKTDEK